MGPSVTDLASASIVFVDNYPHPSIGGGEQHLLRVAEACAQAGAAVHVMCQPGSGLESSARQQGHSVVPVDMHTDLFGSSSRISHALAELRPTIVHFHGAYVTFAGASGARASGASAVLSTVHSMPSASLALRPGLLGKVEFMFRRTLTQRSAAHIDRWICVVEAACSELRQMGLPAERLATIPNGIPVPAAPDEDDVESSSGLVVGSMGRFEKPKGYECFIDAAAVVAAADEAARFVLAGDGSLRSALESRVSELGLSDRFSFPGWSSDPLMAIRAMDIYVVSSVTETTNLSALEAMALGRPMVATAVGGLPEIVDDGNTGYLVPPRDPSVLAARILELLGDRDLRLRMGQAGRARFEERFTVDKMQEEHLSLYRSLLEAHGPDSPPSRR